jgi:hypothetical protein
MIEKARKTDMRTGLRVRDWVIYKYVCGELVYDYDVGKWRTVKKD